MKIKYEFGRGNETYDKDDVVRYLEQQNAQIERLAVDMVSAVENFSANTPQFDTHFLYQSYNAYQSVLQGYGEVEMSMPVGDATRISWHKYAVVPVHIIRSGDSFTAYIEYNTNRKKVITPKLPDWQYVRNQSVLGHPVHLPQSPVEYFYDMAQTYTVLLEENEVALAAVKSGGKVYAHTASYFLEPSYPHGAVKLEKLASSVVCQKCGRWVYQQALTRHTSSRTCKAETTSKDVREAGYVNITHVRGLNRVLKSDVGVVARPKSIEYWAPRWVADAISRYNEGKGFAGMTLDEYLDKMKPDDADEKKLSDDTDIE